MSEHAAHEHWDTSIWPLVISVGILFALPLAFSFKFVYHSPLFAVLCLGLGVPMIIAGITGWTSEAIGEKGDFVGLSTPAMGWFILAEAMIFISFFCTYWYLRLIAPTWPPEGSVELPVVYPAIMTAVLVSSSFTIHIGEEKLESGDSSGFIKWLLITMVMGLIFLGMSIYEWNHLFHEGFVYSTNLFSTAFFSITGFHGAHVMIGLGIFLAMLLPAIKGKINKGFVKTGSLYWHFVDIIWFFVVSQLYYW